MTTTDIPAGRYFASRLAHHVVEEFLTMESFQLADAHCKIKDGKSDDGKTQVLVTIDCPAGFYVHLDLIVERNLRNPMLFVAEGGRGLNRMIVWSGSAFQDDSGDLYVRGEGPKRSKKRRKRGK